MVSMSKWTPERLREELDEFLGTGDPDDPRERKRLRIVEAATELFIRHGYRKTSIDEVARGAGVAKGTVYLYFKNKVELLMHTLGEEKRRHVEDLVPIMAPELHPRERLKLWIKTILTVSERMPLATRMISGDREFLIALEEVDQTQAQEWERQRFEFLGELLSDAAGKKAPKAEELRERAMVLFSLAYYAGAIGDPRIRGGIELDRFAETFADMLVDGLGSR